MKTDKQNTINMVPFPKQSSIFKIDPNEAIIYYKLDDNINIQTLAFLPFISGEEVPPYSIMGRFTGLKNNNGTYSIFNLEAKFYTFSKDVDKNDKKKVPYRVTRILLNKDKSTINKVFIFLVIERAKGKFQIGNPDYTYGNQSKEHPIIVNSNAEVNFDVSLPRPKKGTPKPINGGYECNGKAITSG